MEKTLPLYLGPSVIGSVVCRYEDLHITLSAKTYISISGICRAYVRGKNGNLLIGVLAPSGNSFSAEKSISAQRLSSQGLNFDEITYAYAVKAESKQEDTTSGWFPVREIPEALRRSDVIYALAGTTNALLDNATVPRAIAVPLATDRPFPRPDVLCLASPRQINGTLYGVIGISDSGFPKKY
ncbi:MAG: hypothetical protein E7473_09995 [Ruminococcaceae bacterium]|nr:hypothetical protein [Oscillospiraceae bacterium]